MKRYYYSLLKSRQRSLCLLQTVPVAGFSYHIWLSFPCFSHVTTSVPGLVPDPFTSRTSPVALLTIMKYLPLTPIVARRLHANSVCLTAMRAPAWPGFIPPPLARHDVRDQAIYIGKLSVASSQLNLGHLAPCSWEPVVISLNCLLLSMNSTNETLLFDRFLIMYNLFVFTCVIVMFVFHCTHVRMSYVLNSYFLTYLVILC